MKPLESKSDKNIDVHKCMNRKKKLRHILPLCLSIILLASFAVGGTLAYMQEKAETVTNSFILGKITYTLNLKANAENVVMPDELTAKESTALSVDFTADKAPDKTGYTFEGWYYDKECSKQHTDVPGTVITVAYGDKYDSNRDANKVILTLYAKWEANTYEVIYDGNGADKDTMKNSACTYDVEYNLSKNIYARTGYIFSGWNTKEDGTGDSYEDEAKVKNLTAENNGRVTLYAQWTPITYTVKYDSNVDPNANVTQPTGITANSQHTYDVSKELTTNGFKRTGYTFIGWNTQADGKGKSYSDSESVKNLSAKQGDVVTLYAQWGVKSYVIRYHSNGGTGNMPDQVIEWDKLTELKANTFVKSGDYKFMGWAESPYGEAVYLDCQQVVNLKESGILDLYAIWKQNTYTVIFDYNIGSGTPPTKEVMYEEEYGVLPPYLTTDTENLFAGWYTAKEGGTRIYPTTIVNRKENHTLYAHWVPSPANDVIKNLVVHNSADENNDGVVDDMHLEFKCSSSFEKFNIPLKNLVPGQKYKLTYTASNNASFGDYEAGYKNAVYGSYILDEISETGGLIQTPIAKDIIKTWYDREGTPEKPSTNDDELNGPFIGRTITFTATETDMYWTWDFGLMQDHILYDYNIYDISLEPVEPTIKFNDKDLILHNTSKAQILNDHTSGYESHFTFDGDGYAETMYYPITGLTVGTEYTITFDHKIEGGLINNSAYDYGCGISSVIPTTYGSKMDNLGAKWISSKKVFTSLNNVEEVTLTFTATGDTAYWVWNMANCSDTTNCKIDVAVKEFKAKHKAGGSITYYKAN